MQETAPTPQAPSAPGRIDIQLPGGISIQGGQTNLPMRPLTDREISAIRERRSSMSDQLTSAADRRQELANDLRDAPAGTEQGILARIQQLDARILQIEQDIETSGQMLRTGMTVDNGVALVAPPEPRPTGPFGMSDETMAITGAMVSVFFLFPLALGAMRLMFRRAKRIESQPSAEVTQRMDRLEQAIDAVAYEIERVGEAQRFQGKLLSEANLMPALGAQGAEPVRVRANDLGG